MCKSDRLGVVKKCQLQQKLTRPRIATSQIESARGGSDGIKKSSCPGDELRAAVERSLRGESADSLRILSEFRDAKWQHSSEKLAEVDKQLG